METSFVLENRVFTLLSSDSSSLSGLIKAISKKEIDCFVVMDGGGYLEHSLNMILMLSQNNIKIKISSASSAGVLFALAKGADLTNCRHLITHLCSCFDDTTLTNVRNSKYWLNVLSRYEDVLDPTRLYNYKLAYDTHLIKKNWLEYKGNPLDYWIDLHDVLKSTQKITIEK